MAGNKESSLRIVPLSQVRENEVALRPVNKQSEEYTGLVESVKLVGIMNPITVREMRDPETNQKYYALIDGLHRYNAAGDAGLEEIPVHILTIDEIGVLEAQLMANIHKVETRPVEYAKQLERILAHNPTMTQTELSVKLGMSPTWVGQRLGLIKLDKPIQSLVDDGTINLSNAQSLSKLPPEEQGNFVERAMTMSPSEFGPTIQNRVKELRDAARAGRQPASSEFQAVPHVRKLGELKAELDKVAIGPVLIKELGLRTPNEIWQNAIKWALHLDPASVEAAKAKFDQQKAEAEANKQARAKEREEKKAAKAAEAQKAVQAAATA